ncbi:matrix metalloproteinase-2 isoform X1 [Manduca sexta]|nr:matrix metalloproteinase-2 isoform X1 [Manduca sexta]
MLSETFFVTSLFCAVACRTIYLEHNTITLEEVTFLRKYGYMEEAEGDFSVEADFAYTDLSVEEALKKMQAFAGLPQTGTLDTETKKLFRRKRCGVKDIIKNESTISRNKRYILQRGWNKHTITYRVLNGSSTLDKSRVEALIAEGLAVWAPHGMLRFKKVETGPADIKVSFAAGDHGDGFPFDGQGRVVAHAFPPPHGAIHFDDDELWGGDPDAEDDDITDFFAVAVHEIGHALGLSHSNDKASVMYPYYQVPTEKLQMDDILGMRELYLKDGSPSDIEDDIESSSQSSHVPRFTKPDRGEVEENEIPDLCLTNYDTLQVIRGKIYVFEEEWVWVLRDRNTLEEGYPKRFHEVFIGLPASVTVIKTIYEKHNRDIVIFSGRNYWQFSPSFRLMIRGNLSDYHIPPEVPGLTTVFISNYNNKTYLIDDERFWRFDEITETMDDGYPKDMSAWREVPYPVDAAIIWKGDTYFFRGPRFWRFDNSLIKAHEYYPLPTAQIWFDCEASEDMNQYITNDGP